jgi:hypothetical protein
VLSLSWSGLLRRWEADWQAHGPEAEEDRRPLAAPPATEADIAAAEARLGVRLPPSYREFLTVSNGWRRTGVFVSGLRPVGQIGWFRDLEREWYEIWRDLDTDGNSADVALMARAVVVSAPESEDALLLDPARVDPVTGEWHACTFSNKHPGASAGSTFREEVESLYLDFVRFEVPAGETRTELGARRDRALSGALAGDLAAVEELRRLAPYDWRAACADAQVTLLRRDTHFHPALWWEAPDMPVERSRTDPVVLRDVVPAWVVASQDLNHDLAYELTRTPEPVLGVLRDCHVAVGSGTGLTADFSYAPAFAAAVDDARDLLPRDPDAAWRRIVGALPAWRPLAPHHVLPLGLLYDRDLGRLLRPGPEEHRSGVHPTQRQARVAELLGTPRAA